MIEIKNLSVTYPKTSHISEIIALKNINLKIEDNTFYVVVGSSGSGKTTLLNTICGILNYKGEIYFDGVESNLIDISDRNISLTSQKFVLYPQMNIFENIAFPLKSKGAAREEIIAAVNEVANSLGLEFLLTRKPKELSIGQQQRVALARTLIKKPKIYLFDEPLSNADEQTRVELKRLIKLTVERYGSTAIYVTHNINEALSLADKIIVLDEGEVVLIDTPRNIMKSDNKIVRDLFKAAYVL